MIFVVFISIYFVNCHFNILYIYEAMSAMWKEIFTGGMAMPCLPMVTIQK